MSTLFTQIGDKRQENEGRGTYCAVRDSENSYLLRNTPSAYFAVLLPALESEINTGV